MCVRIDWGTCPLSPMSDSNHPHCVTAIKPLRIAPPMWSKHPMLPLQLLRGKDGGPPGSGHQLLWPLLGLRIGRVSIHSTNLEALLRLLLHLLKTLAKWSGLEKTQQRSIVVQPFVRAYHTVASVRWPCCSCCCCIAIACMPARQNSWLARCVASVWRVETTRSSSTLLL